jgi:DNA-binding response OmpR family regulator
VGIQRSVPGADDQISKRSNGSRETQADAYLLKPFNAKGLILKLRSFVRRDVLLETPSILRTGNLEINLAAMTVHVSGAPVGLSLMQFRILEFLARHPGEAVSRQDLIRAIWNGSPPRTVHKTLDAFIRQLRIKLESDPHNPVYLRTIRNVGYCFGEGV